MRNRVDGLEKNKESFQIEVQTQFNEMSRKFDSPVVMFGEMHSEKNSAKQFAEEESVDEKSVKVKNTKLREPKIVQNKAPDNFKPQFGDSSTPVQFLTQKGNSKEALQVQHVTQKEALKVPIVSYNINKGRLMVSTCFLCKIIIFVMIGMTIIHISRFLQNEYGGGGGGGVSNWLKDGLYLPLS